MEYAFGSHPKIPDSGFAPNPLTLDDSGKRYFGLSYRRRLGVTDLNYLIEYSSDLADWNQIVDTVLMNSVNNGNGSVTDTYRLSDTFDSSLCNYLRLRVLGK